MPHSGNNTSMHSVLEQPSQQNVLETKFIHQHHHQHHDKISDHDQNPHHDHSIIRSSLPSPLLPILIRNSKASMSGGMIHKNSKGYNQHFRSNPHHMSGLTTRPKHGSRGSIRRSTLSQNHRQNPKNSQELLYMIPRGVGIQYGPYTFHGVTDFRQERLQGLEKVLTKMGATTKLIPNTDYRNQVHVWYMDTVIFNCKITDLIYGGDGELDPLCMHAARQFDHVCRKSIHGLRNRVKLTSQDGHHAYTSESSVASEKEIISTRKSIKLKKLLEGLEHEETEEEEEEENEDTEEVDEEWDDTLEGYDDEEEEELPKSENLPTN